MTAVIIDNVPAAIDTTYAFITGQACMIIVKITNKNHKAFRQFGVVQSFAQAPAVNAALVVSDAPLQTVTTDFLHFDIVVSASSIVQIDI